MADNGPLTHLAFGMFAMHQDLPLDAMAPLGNPPALVAPRKQSPEWFAAASSPDASLLDMAPELLAMPPAPLPEDVEPAVRADSDIIGIYAPETSGEYKRPVLVPHAPVAPAGSMTPEPVDEEDETQHPRARIQMGLLRELSDLDP